MSDISVENLSLFVISRRKSPGFNNQNVYGGGGKGVLLNHRFN